MVQCLVKEADRWSVVGNAEAHMWAALEAAGDVGADKPLESGRVHDVPAEPPAERARPVEARRAENVAEDACTSQINRFVQSCLRPSISSCRAYDNYLLARSEPPIR